MLAATPPRWARPRHRARAAGGGRRLVAFVAPGPGAAVAGPAELAAHLAEAVPRYMVPHTFVVLDRLPLTAGGKVDRKALVVPAGVEVPPAAAAGPRARTPRRSGR
ncbi:hypothetical protein ACFSNO_28165 [Streptomyces cirratus]